MNYYQPQFKFNGWHFLSMVISLILWIFIIAGIRGCQITAAHAETLTASWYSQASLKKEGTWKISHGIMANGKEFKDEDFTCATWLYPLGTRLRVTNIKTGRYVFVKVTDRIGRRFAKTRIDLTPIAFSRIAELKEGLVAVKTEEVKQDDPRNPALRRSHKDIHAATKL